MGRWSNCFVKNMQVHIFDKAFFLSLLGKLISFYELWIQDRGLE